MPFQKGHKLAKGRPVGAINRSTEMMKLSIARATNKVLDDLPAIMEDIIKQDPKAAVDLATYVVKTSCSKLNCNYLLSKTI